ncbi:transcription initiation factor TFIID subunit 7-like isoform X1 [Onthophagus taurus]|uniref:transcription initiation factor TFIID subunit 7-like isoform X1 n=1 Tax=Onthophagus taurus TaxID=166361 RepID=UPI000C20AF72|nr:transcription initiation factor TFIID subunit 7-like [Onthophagus taurus]
MSTKPEVLQKFDLEDQFILRLPQEQAKFVRKVLKKKPKKIKKYLTLDFEFNMRYCNVFVHRKLLKGKLVDLPTIVESNKTVDGVQIFKTADVSQMLICTDEETFKINEAKVKYKTDDMKQKYQYLHGITPPLKNISNIRFRKTLRNKNDLEEAADVEKEVLILLRMDNAAVTTRFEFIQDEKATTVDIPLRKVTELSIFGDTISDIESDDDSSTGDRNDIMDFTH